MSGNAGAEAIARKNILHSTGDFNSGLYTNWKKVENKDDYFLSIPELKWNNDDHRAAIQTVLGSEKGIGVGYSAGPINPKDPQTGTIITISKDTYNTKIIDAALKERRKTRTP